ncbi:hypothetical protein CPC08DRAFT_729965 [Agrocybe pediades]|nr:hypothetical protein CPC08DRAFT_729965 [Agrocybe pediades]
MSPIRQVTRLNKWHTHCSVARKPAKLRPRFIYLLVGLLRRPSCTSSLQSLFLIEQETLRLASFLQLTLIMPPSPPFYHFSHGRRPSKSSSTTGLGDFVVQYRDPQLCETLELDLSLPLDHLSLVRIDRLLPQSPRKSSREPLLDLRICYAKGGIGEEWDDILNRVQSNAHRIKSLSTGPTIIEALMRYDPLSTSTTSWTALESLEIKRMYKHDDEHQVNHILIEAPNLTKLVLKPSSLISSYARIPYSQITHLSLVEVTSSLVDCRTLLSRFLAAGSKLIELQVTGRSTSVLEVPSILDLLPSSLVFFSLHNHSSSSIVATRSSISAGSIDSAKLKMFEIIYY